MRTISVRTWLVGGLVTVAAGGVWAFFEVNKNETTIFHADGSFATLAGFAVLALALERFCEAVLAPWWGKVSTQEVKEVAKSKPGDSGALASARKLIGNSRTRVGVSEATLLKAAADKAVTAAGKKGINGEEKAAAEQTAEATNSAWVEALRERPTLVLPAAAIATVLCAYLHLFLLHGVASAIDGGIPTSKLAFAVDALVGGLALAGGAKPFHDLTESIAASAGAKKADVAAK